MTLYAKVWFNRKASPILANVGTGDNGVFFYVSSDFPKAQARLEEMGLKRNARGNMFLGAQDATLDEELRTSVGYRWMTESKPTRVIIGSADEIRRGEGEDLQLSPMSVTAVAPPEEDDPF